MIGGLLLAFSLTVWCYTTARTSAEDARLYIANAQLYTDICRQFSAEPKPTKQVCQARAQWAMSPRPRWLRD